MAVGSRTLENLVMLPDAAFWRGKRVLLTGHTGFKGAWLTLWLHRLGADVVGVALAPAGQPNLFDQAALDGMAQSHLQDIRDADALGRLLHQTRPEIVLHLAAQALVRVGYEQPAATFSTNVMGTVNLLEAVRGQRQVRVAVVVTTDKVYHSRESVYPYREDDALGGHDPYSASKAAAELVAASYRDAFLAQAGTALATARAGNVIGGGDWALDRLLPDAFRAWSTGSVLQVRRPQAVRPWQHVLEPLAAYLVLAERLWQQPDLAGAYNFGPASSDACTVQQLVGVARQAFGSGDSQFHSLGNSVVNGPHEAATLTLEVALARARLGITPLWNVARGVQQTMAWYRSYQQGRSARDLCLADLADYEGSHAAPAGS